MSNLLFICSKNQWRSPTAEALFKNHPIHQARSAGTSDKARIRLSQKLIDWADLIFVMEAKHRDIVKRRFIDRHHQINVLGIDDIYQFNDPELVELFKVLLADYL